jgi:very-short-patch-repair endonuclease
LYFLQSPDSHFRGSGCPSCNESKGEKLIAKYLDNKKIKYHREYKFDDCKNIGLLKFDFYLPEHNLCIEYDGRQHFESIDIFGGDIEFEKRKINDKIKNNFCINSKIELLRIPFFQKNIESLLQEYFTKIKA